MKQHADIPDLLDRYWAGETTLDEERRLKTFFDAETLPEQFRAEAVFFKALRAEQAVQYSGKAPKTVSLSTLNGRWMAAAAAVLVLLCAGLFWWTAEPERGPEQAVQVPPSVEQPTPPPQKTELAQTPIVPEPAPALAQATVKRKAVPRKKTAAPPTEPTPEDSYDDPEAALAEIKAALSLVSSKINRSKQALDKGLQEVEHVDIFHKKNHEISG